MENPDGFHIYYLMEFLLLEKSYGFSAIEAGKTCARLRARARARLSYLWVQGDASAGWINAVSRIWYKVALRLYGPVKRSGKCTL